MKYTKKLNKLEKITVNLLVKHFWILKRCQRMTYSFKKQEVKN